MPVQTLHGADQRSGTAADEELYRSRRDLRRALNQKNTAEKICLETRVPRTHIIHSFPDSPNISVHPILCGKKAMIRVFRFLGQDTMHHIEKKMKLIDRETTE